jgi:purine-binding chemotaxis protein CheW
MLHARSIAGNFFCYCLSRPLSLSPPDEGSLAMKTFLLFALEDRRFALRLEAVRRVVHMVAITPLPDAADPICGMINVQGEMAPVFDIRRLCGIEPTPPSTSDHLVLASAGNQTVALRVDAAKEVVTLSEERTASLEGLISGRVPAEGIAPVSGDLVFIVDPERLLAHARSAIEVLS